jgi:hypothetical protein
MDQNQNVANMLRDKQGRTPVIEVKGSGGKVRSYSFRRLVRRELQETRFDLISPLMRCISKFKDELISAGTTPADLLKGDIDIETILKMDISSLADVLDTVGFSRVWELARRLLNGAEIDGAIMLSIDEDDYFNDKPIEMVRAVILAAKLINPFTESSESTGSGSTATPTTNG